MHIKDILEKHPTTFSFEFFPPKTEEASEVLYQTIQELEKLKPSFVSVTYGAGGGTRDLTHDLVVRMKNETTLDPVSHLTTVCHTDKEILDILERYAKAGISNVLALRGDPPKDLQGYDRKNDTFQYASEFVAFIKKFNNSGKHPDPRGFGIGVAGFPEGHFMMPNRTKEMDYLKAKVDCGADYICTQLFFENNDFYDWVERCEISGIHTPIIAGIMPITSYAVFERIPDLALGSRYPAKLLKKLLPYKDDPESFRKAGIEWATEQCRNLLENGVRGLHFYTLNRSKATVEIYKNLGAKDSAELGKIAN